MDPREPNAVPVTMSTPPQRSLAEYRAEKRTQLEPLRAAVNDVLLQAASNNNIKFKFEVCICADETVINGYVVLVEIQVGHVTEAEALIRNDERVRASTGKLEFKVLNRTAWAA